MSAHQAKEHPMTSTDTPKRAAIYARISKDDAGYAVGVHDQARQCRALVADKGWTVTGPQCGCAECERFKIPADIYCDNDVTAEGKRRRPHYDRLLEDVAAGRVDVVVAAHTDRLHRNVTELERYIDTCEPRKVETHTVKAGELDMATSAGRTVARMLGVIARGELERMMERQKAAKKRNRDAGIRWSGTRPFGYQLDERDARGRQIPGVSVGMVKDKAESAAVFAAYESVLAGVPYNTIASQWTQAGLRTPVRGYRLRDDGEPDPDRPIGGRPFNGTEVKRLLLCARNAGLIEHGGQILGKAKWEQIVSEDTWRAARDMMLSRTGSATVSPGPAPRWWLKGVLICGVCGCRRFRVISKGKVMGYQCASMLEDRTAPGAGWHLHRNARSLENYVEAVIIERLSRADVVAALNTRPSVDIPALDRRRTAINAELEEWARAPGITPRQLQIKNAPLLAELEQVERQISEGLRGDPLPEFAGKDPVKVWATLKADGNVERMRAIAALLLRVKVLRTGRTGRRPLDESSVKILPPDA
jgi:DNA invertase Pin-like site-specific DNA recombinase